MSHASCAPATVCGQEGRRGGGRGRKSRRGAGGGSARSNATEKSLRGRIGRRAADFAPSREAAAETEGNGRETALGSGSALSGLNKRLRYPLVFQNAIRLRAVMSRAHLAVKPREDIETAINERVIHPLPKRAAEGLQTESGSLSLATVMLRSSYVQ